MTHSKKLVAVSVLSVLLACSDAVDLNAPNTNAFISGHLSLDPSCHPQADLLLSNGVFDIASRKPLVSCARPYTMHLLVDTQLGDLVLFDKAEVALLDLAGQTLAFQDGDALPNPFDVLTAGRVSSEAHEGVIGVNAIPRKYATKLVDYVGDGIVVSVRLSGTTPAGAHVTTQTFRFPVEICNGCLSTCFSHVQPGDDPYGDGCVDNAAADGRTCVDRGC